MRLLLATEDPRRAAAVFALLEDAAPGAFSVHAAPTPAAAVELLLGAARPPVDAVVLAARGGLEELALAEQLRTAALDLPLVVLSDAADATTGDAVVRSGAQDHLPSAGLDGATLARALRHALARKARENALARQALHDPLTALPNRTLLLDRLRQALSRIDRTQTCLAVMLLDLDGFKAVNDTHGHAAGDALLCEVAAALRSALRGGDTAARLGGDEFVVVCEDVAGEEEARAIAVRLLASLPAPASLGVALTADGTASRDELVRRADRAMYAAKRRGGGTFVVGEDRTIVA